MENARRKLLESKYGVSKFEEDPRASVVTPNFRMSVNTRQNEDKSAPSTLSEERRKPQADYAASQPYQYVQEFVANLENECTALKQANSHLSSQIEIFLVKSPLFVFFTVRCV